MKHTHIMPECFIDTNFIETILGSEVNHQRSCGAVINKLKTNFSDRFAIGIIDNDKRRMPYLEECHEIIKSRNFILVKHNQKPHYIFVINPAIEKFILSNAKTLNLNLKDFDLPSDFKDLKEQTKKIGANKDATFKRLFKAMINTPEITLLKECLCYLLKQTYKANEADLQQLSLGHFIPSLSRKVPESSNQ